MVRDSPTARERLYAVQVTEYSQATKAASLAAEPLFARLSKKGLDQLATMTDDLDFPAGKVLCRQGEQGG